MSSLSFGDLVSVVIPAYNHERYIQQALDSVYEQTYLPIELIVLDDCSKDKTFKLAKEWETKINAKKRFVRVIIEKNTANLGAHDTINRGMSLAQGSALTILNSDDAYSPNRLEIFMQTAARTQAQWMFSGLRVVNEVGKKVFSDLANNIESSVDYVATYPSLCFALLKRNIVATTGNLFFSRELYNAVGPFRNLRYCHDWDFALQACLFSEPILIDKPLYDYRVHSANSFSTLKVQQYLESQIVYWHYFAACRAGNCKNPNAPWSANWPGFFDEWIKDDSSLNGAFYLVGHDLVKYDRIAQSVNYFTR